MSELFKHFGKDMKNLDFGDQRLLELYNHESYGSPLPSPEQNGFAIGKRYLNLQVTMWKEDLYKGLLFKHELYEEPSYPHWWLDSIFKDTTDLRGDTLKRELLTCERMNARSND